MTVASRESLEGWPKRAAVILFFTSAFCLGGKGARSKRGSTDKVTSHDG